VFVNQRFDAWLRRREAGGPRGFALPYKPLWALGAYLGNFAFMLGVTVYLFSSNDVPSSVPLGGILASGLALSGAFVAFAGVLIGRGLRGKSQIDVTATAG
jgi:hypothetical protein